MRDGDVGARARDLEKRAIVELELEVDLRCDDDDKEGEEDMRWRL